MANVKYRKLGEEDTRDSDTDCTDDDEEEKERNSTTSQKGPHSWFKMALKVTAVLVVFMVIGAVIVPYVVAGPLHAQCTINW